MKNLSFSHGLINVKQHFNYNVAPCNLYKILIQHAKDNNLNIKSFIILFGNQFIKPFNI